MRGVVAALLTVLALSIPPDPATAAPSGVRFRPVAFADLLGWADDDQRAALAAFVAACPDLGSPQPRAASRELRLRDLCRAARGPEGADARVFFETRFTPLRVEPEASSGLLTGYFEPVLDGSLVPDPAFPIPLLARPDGMVLRADAAGEAFPEGVSTARRTMGGLEPWPTREAIEAGALGEAARPVVFLRDRADALMVHVQGSARVRLPDGRTVRVAFDGRNGHPYKAIGRVLAERLGRPPREMTADVVYAWLRDHPDEAPSVTGRNASFIFFRVVDGPEAADRPVGAAGWPLADGRSVAIDPTFWPFGLPVWLDAERDGPEDAPLRRLAVAADAGSAIVGPTRADLFIGSGAAAGIEAGRLRRPLAMTVLWPVGLPLP